jgi:hypothetical protein
MWRYRCAALTFMLLLAGARGGLAFDMAHVTRSTFLASAHDNIGAIIMWLHGYHAGKSGVVRAADVDEMHKYGEKLGHFCRQHPNASVIDASEYILSQDAI